ncbi:hypothetical protein PINS_up007720 [Pythium insidiosum]|nr:hypothetical protein PINS_up007720 [Pythium insidiosum]
MVSTVSQQKKDDGVAVATGPLELGSSRSMTTYLFNNVQDEEAMQWTHKAAATSSSPTLHIELSARRFLFVIGTSVAVLVAILVLCVHGITIRPRVEDELGSTKNANEIVEHYQTINGYVTATVGKCIENVFEIFTAVAVTYLANVALYPSDDPDRPPSKLKRFFLIAFVPVLMFLLNVAVTAAFIKHTNVDVLRVFLSSDLIATQLSLQDPTSTLETNATLDVKPTTHVIDTILLPALRGRHDPFELFAQSACVTLDDPSNDEADDTTDSEDEEEDFPSVREVRSTTVVYGFPTREWNVDALPTNLQATHSLQIQLNETVDAVNTAFSKFMRDANVSWVTTYELFLQGKLLFERSITDANVSAEYPCTWADGRGDRDLPSDPNPSSVNSNSTVATSAPPTSRPTNRSPPHRQLTDNTTVGYSGDDGGDVDGDDDDGDDLPVLDYFEEGPHKGMRRCYGAVSTLRLLENITDPSMHSADELVGTMIASFNATVPNIDAFEMKLTLQTFDVNPQMKLTTMTIDIPYTEGTQYRDVTQFCDKSGGQLKKEIAELVFTNETTKELKEATRALLCDQNNYPYVSPKTTCGSHNGIFLDKSGTLSFKKQLQLMPCQTKCSTANMRYNNDFHTFLPSDCEAQHSSVFLYGLGTYITADSFQGPPLPYLVGARRHVVLTFAKLEWTFEELHKKFDAQCAVPGGCHGILHNLENVTVPRITPNKTVKDTYLRVLLVNNASLPAERMSKDYRDPVQLVNLNTRPFYYAKEKRYYEWEYLDSARVGEYNWTTTLEGKDCSLIVDSYMRQIDRNNYFLDRPLQPLYSAAFYYLFQDAAVKSVKLSKNVTTGAELLSLA